MIATVSWNLVAGENIRVFRGHSEGLKSGFDPGVYRVGVTSSGRYTLSVGDAYLRVWDITSGREVPMMVSFEDGEWLTITPEDYYDSSSNGHKYLRLLIGANAYSTELFYDVFCCPDIVAAKLNGEDRTGLATLTMNEAIRNPQTAVEFISLPERVNEQKTKICYRVKNNCCGIGEVGLSHNGKLIHSDG